MSGLTSVISCPKAGSGLLTDPMCALTIIHRVEVTAERLPHLSHQSIASMGSSTGFARAEAAPPGQDTIMDVESTFKKDHPFDLKRPKPSADGSIRFEHLLTVVPVKIRGRAVETCFLARPDVSILRQDARTRHPRLPRERQDTGFQILKLTLDAGDRVEIGTGADGN